VSITKILACIIGPAIFWIAYLYYKDRQKPEPLLFIGITYILGYMAGYAAFNCYKLLPLLGLPADPSILMAKHGLSFLLYCLGPVGFLEEIIKFIPFLVLVLRFRAFDEEIDGIVYASVIALGFASYENIFHLVYLDGFELFGRAIASPLTHTIFSSIWGFTVARAKFSGKSMLLASIIGIIIASLCHGFFDYFTTSPYLRMLAAFTILAIWIWRIRIMDKLNKNNQSIS
jgi:RsiW-degrading membrane proteinase PrsW (M82 family)